MVSTLSVDVIGVGSYGSTITGANVTLNEKAYAGGAIVDAGFLALIVTVNDSRGRSGSAIYTIEVADYAPPTLKLDASRCLEDGTADEMGEFAKVTVIGTVIQVNDANTATLSITFGSSNITEIFEAGDINYTTIVPAPSVSTMAIAATMTDQLKNATQSMVLLPFLQW